MSAASNHRSSGSGTGASKIPRIFVWFGLGSKIETYDGESAGVPPSWSLAGQWPIDFCQKVGSQSAGKS